VSRRSGAGASPASSRLAVLGSALAVPVTLIGALAIITAAASAANLAVQNRVTTMLIYVVLVVGYYSFAGTSGVLSFGHMSFMSVGAYVMALLVIPAGTKAILLPALPHWLGHTTLAFLPAVIVAAACAAVIAAVVSVPMMRLPSLAISLGMFAFLVILYDVESNWTSVTRGQAAMLGLPTSTTPWVAFGGAAVAIALVAAYQASAWGLRVRAAREDHLAASAMGVNVVRARRISLVVSALVIGMGGALYAEQIGVLTPDNFYLDITFLTIAMFVIGGTHSLTGAVAGPVAVSVLNYLLDHLEAGLRIGRLSIPGRPGIAQLGLAVVMLLILIFRPRGLTGGREARLPFPRRRQPPEETQAPRPPEMSNLS
jgi:branched-chain amino acid transport system permease protein